MRLELCLSKDKKSYVYYLPHIVKVDSGTKRSVFRFPLPAKLIHSVKRHHSLQQWRPHTRRPARTSESVHCRQVPLELDENHNADILYMQCRRGTTVQIQTAGIAEEDTLKDEGMDAMYLVDGCGEDGGIWCRKHVDLLLYTIQGYILVRTIGC